MPWSTRFDEPIPLPRGCRLVTLEDAGDYITKHPKAEHEAAEWQAAMEALIWPESIWDSKSGSDSTCWLGWPAWRNKPYSVRVRERCLQPLAAPLVRHSVMAWS